VTPTQLQRGKEEQNKNINLYIPTNLLIGGKLHTCKEKNGGKGGFYRCTITNKNEHLQMLRGFQNFQEHYALLSLRNGQRSGAEVKMQ